ncbi:hypothetical protein MKX08_000846 [Trichoderma sp. CBMAI-0020]|nr:hypothetical protein MKX08_000846 [Trichoderma sp. CBMAI-0020]
MECTEHRQATALNKEGKQKSSASDRDSWYESQSGFILRQSYTSKTISHCGRRGDYLAGFTSYYESEQPTYLLICRILLHSSRASKAKTHGSLQRLGQPLDKSKSSSQCLIETVAEESGEGTQPNLRETPPMEHFTQQVGETAIENRKILDSSTLLRTPDLQGGLGYR